MVDFTIIIAHRGSALGLWSTVQSCEMELLGSGLNYNYVIIENGIFNKDGKPQLDADLFNTVWHLDKIGRIKQFIRHPKPLSPPTARQLAAAFADGETLFFFDNHCLVAKDYFARAMADFKHYPIDMLHSTTMFYSGGQPNYHYKLTLDKNFWGESATIPTHELKPYKMAVGGHGGFAIKREVWQAVGGYWNGFVGYGGEEPYFDLKLWQMGYTVWMDPKVVHYHYAGVRPYARHYTTEFFVNMLSVANIIGGQSRMLRLIEGLKKYPQKVGTDLFDLSMVAQERSQPHADYLASVRKMNLDETLQYFRENLIAH